MFVEVIHTTELSYDRPISETVMELRLQPASDEAQRCHAFELRMDPPGYLAVDRDRFGNVVHHYNYRPPHRRILVVARSVVESGLAGEILTPELWRFQYLSFDGPVLDLPAVEDMADQLRPVDPADASSVEGAVARLTELVHDRFQYLPGATNASSTVADLIRLGTGVCQDFTHVWIAVSRALGIPARYVSGYVHHRSDASSTSAASHAWGEAWIPGRGWRGYDPTNPLRITPFHVKVAVGRDYRDAAPTKGVFLGPAVERVTVDVQTRVLDSLPPGPVVASRR